MILTVSGAEGADFAAEALADKYRSEGKAVTVLHHLNDQHWARISPLGDREADGMPSEVIIRIKRSRSPYLTVTGMRS